CCSRPSLRNAGGGTQYIVGGQAVRSASAPNSRSPCGHRLARFFFECCVIAEGLRHFWNSGCVCARTGRTRPSRFSPLRPARGTTVFSARTERAEERDRTLRSADSGRQVGVGREL